uniref:Uncharacterized protein n=1 Tax=Ascaris lumbricoides TaxID=6252 RepID=A0A9J2PUA0_ASCLU
MRELPETDTETVVLEMCNEMMKYPLNYSLLAAPPPDHSGNSLLHLCAVLNFHRTIPNEERSPLTKESVNSTALWVMTNGETVTDEQRLAHGSSLTSSCLVQTQDRCSPDKSINQSSDLSDVDSAHQNGSSQSSDDHHHLETACLMKSYGPDSHFCLHVAWLEHNMLLSNDAVMGCSSDCQMSSEGSSWMEGPLSMDVHIPDSPTTAGMWNALESNDNAASEGARARMASLAQQIIDALPARIKSSSTAVESNCLDDVGGLSEPSSSGLSDHSKNPFLGNACVSSSSEWEKLISPLQTNNYGFSPSPNFMGREGEDVRNGKVGPLDVLNASSSTSAFTGLQSASVQPAATAAILQMAITVTKSWQERAVTETWTITADMCSEALPPVTLCPQKGYLVGFSVGFSSTFDFRDLGEFFNTEGVMGPLERHFRDLRLSELGWRPEVGRHYPEPDKALFFVIEPEYCIGRFNLFIFFGGKTDQTCESKDRKSFGFDYSVDTVWKPDETVFHDFIEETMNAVD